MQFHGPRISWAEKTETDLPPKGTDGTKQSKPNRNHSFQPRIYPVEEWQQFHGVNTDEHENDFHSSEAQTERLMNANKR